MEELHVHSESAKPEEGLFLLAVSVEAVTSTEGKRSMQLMGVMHNVQVHILIDSGSTNSFISQHAVAKMPGLSLCPAHVQVKVANSDILSCSSAVPDAEWTIQGCQFK